MLSDTVWVDGMGSGRELTTDNYTLMALHGLMQHYCAHGVFQASFLRDFSSVNDLHKAWACGWPGPAVQVLRQKIQCSVPQGAKTPKTGKVWYG